MWPAPQLQSSLGRLYFVGSVVLPLVEKQAVMIGGVGVQVYFVPHQTFDQLEYHRAVRAVWAIAHLALGIGKVSAGNPSP